MYTLPYWAFAQNWRSKETNLLESREFTCLSTVSWNCSFWKFSSILSSLSKVSSVYCDIIEIFISYRRLVVKVVRITPWALHQHVRSLPLLPRINWKKPLRGVLQNSCFSWTISRNNNVPITEQQVLEDYRCFLLSKVVLYYCKYKQLWCLSFFFILFIEFALILLFWRWQRVTQWKKLA